MTTIQSPSHALGLMAMGAYDKIMQTLPETLLNPDGPKKVCALIFGLDGMMFSFHDKMYHIRIMPNGDEVKTRYPVMMRELNQRYRELRFGNTSQGELWLEYFHDYLKLLSSCFNQIGLAPLKTADNVTWDEYAYIPPEPGEDTQPDDEAVPDQNLESNTS